jgi:hypothetical protein
MKAQLFAESHHPTHRPAHKSFENIGDFSFSDGHAGLKNNQKKFKRPQIAPNFSCFW